MPLYALMLGYATLKGVTVALFTLIIGTTFLQSLIVAALSGTLGLLGMMAAAYISARERLKDRRLLHAIKETVEKPNGPPEPK